jgi:hypothetical protein
MFLLFSGMSKVILLFSSPSIGMVFLGLWVLIVHTYIAIEVAAGTIAICIINTIINSDFSRVT